MINQTTTRKANAEHRFPSFSSFKVTWLFSLQHHEYKQTASFRLQPNTGQPCFLAPSAMATRICCSHTSSTLALIVLRHWSLSHPVPASVHVLCNHSQHHRHHRIFVVLRDIRLLHRIRDIEVFVLHCHLLTCPLLLLVPPRWQHTRGLSSSQKIAKNGKRRILSIDAVVVLTPGVVVLAAQTESVDEHLVGLRLRVELAEVTDEARMRRAAVGWSSTCGFMLGPVCRLTFYRQTGQWIVGLERPPWHLLTFGTVARFLAPAASFQGRTGGQLELSLAAGSTDSLFGGCVCRVRHDEFTLLLLWVDIGPALKQV